MINIKQIVVTILVSALVAGLMLFVYQKNVSGKIAYIHSGKVVQETSFYKERLKALEQEAQVMQTNLDTLQNRYERLKVQGSTVTADKRAVWEYELRNAEQNFLKYQQQVQTQLQTKENELLTEVFSKINDVVRVYAEEEGFEYILGSTNEGNIMYAPEALDVTEAIIEKLNSK